ncbi:hypothetical protein [Neobacillus ginsengisoli]|uniref:hypothetical protein n=1 Tax=Neobacillus ginsengisoli TaxID=904295 RepID=UPI0027D809CE|nr:hypothetical protein [Neobacillus ginsengisoli]
MSNPWLPEYDLNSKQAGHVIAAQFLRRLHQYPIQQAKNLGVPHDQLNRLNIEIRKNKLEENVKLAIKDGLLLNKERTIDYLTKLHIVEEGPERVAAKHNLYLALSDE